MDRVPLIGPNVRYDLLHDSSTWIIQRFAAGAQATGVSPKVGAVEVGPTTVKAGYASYDGLTQGGLFTLPGNYRKPTLVESLDNPAGATITILQTTSNHERPIPSTYPFKLAPGEFIKTTGGTAGSYVGILVKEAVAPR